MWTCTVMLAEALASHPWIARNVSRFERDPCMLNTATQAPNDFGGRDATVKIIRAVATASGGRLPDGAKMTAEKH